MQMVISSPRMTRMNADFNAEAWRAEQNGFYRRNQRKQSLETTFTTSFASVGGLRITWTTRMSANFLFLFV